MVDWNKIPQGEVCHICGKKAERIERDTSRVPTGKYICKAHYMKKSRYGTYEKPEKIYNKGNRCEFIDKYGKRCPEKLYPGNAYRETDKYGKKTEIWFCFRHGYNSYQKYDPDSHFNIKKSMRNRRTENLDPNSSQVKGDEFQELTYTWKEFVDLNKENDNYNSPIDLIDPKTKLRYQVKGCNYNSINRYWSQNFENEINSSEMRFEFKTLFLFCVSKDGKTIERLYEIPYHEIIKRKSITILKYNSRGELYTYGWYEQYRLKDEDVFKKVNNIWEEIIKKRSIKNRSIKNI